MRFFIKRNNSYAARCRIAGTVAIVISAIAPVSAQEKPGDSALTARSVFERLQAPAVELLKPSARLDMLDYWDADSIYQVKNGLNGMSSLVAVEPDYLKVNVTPVSTLEIKLLPAGKQTLAMTVYTVGGEGQARDSSVAFYDASTLAQLDASRYFTEPPLKAFFDIPKGATTSMKEIEDMIPFATVEYSASSGSDDLKAHLTVAEYMNMDDWNIAKIFLRPEVAIPWKGKYKAK